MKIKPNKTLKQVGWSRTPLIAFALAVGLAMGSCGAIHNLPKEETVVNYVDSTVLHIKDSTVIREKTRYRDMAWLGDSLVIRGQRSKAWAVADTAREVIVGGLEEEPVKEKYKTVYKDKIVYRDSIRTVEVPVEVEKIVEKRYIPFLVKVFAILGLISILYFGIKLFLFFKK